ncbi:uncharacterized protein LOC131880816 [Tigriopus californicus]|uniref:uncharacterized protein LOC131880816 n=1 Tax=Tigriopus californicus TaxID=6832 RepID=UPI0027D9F7D1|nr:uncharacterized protein LOC131880816 [Tigriopus californicus]
MFPDLFGTLEHKFNFSLSHTFETDWGVMPIEGTFENGTFGGAFGGVINGAFDMSLSSWRATPERGLLLDMEPVQMTDFVLAVVPKTLGVDLKFFQHPFSIDAWQGILLVAFLICVTIIPPSLLLGNYENTDAYNWASLSAWSFFLLINSFYCGALTMFFSTKAAPPFSQFHEVVQAYPTWILKTPLGSDIFFHAKAKSGDPSFKAFYERMVHKPEETTFTDAALVLKKMDAKHIAIIASTNQLKYTYETNLDLTTPLDILTTLNKAWNNIILKKHSPLSPIIRRGMNSLRDHALLQRVMSRWFGFDIPKASESSLMALGMGHTLLVYFIMMSACLLSLTLLSMEHLYARLFSK